METTVKTNKYIFFCINLLLMLPVLRREDQPLAGLLCAGAFQLAAFCCVVLWSGDTVPASAHLTTLFFFNFWSCAGLHIVGLVNNLDIDYLAYVSQLYMENSISLLLAAAGVAMAFVGLRKKALSWLLGPAGGAAGASFILLFWSRGSPGDFSLAPGGAALLAVFLLGVLVWMVFFQIVLYVRLGKRGVPILLGALLLCGAAALCSVDFGYIQTAAAGLEARLLELPETLLAWRRIGPACVLLLGCAAVMFHGKEKRFSLDSLVASICGLLLLAVRLLMSSYFLGGWIVLLLFVLGMFRCLKNWIAGQKTFGLRALPCLAAQTGIFFLTIKAFQTGLWLNVLIAAAFGWGIARAKSKQMDAEDFKRFQEPAYTGFLVVEALAWQWKMRSSPEGIALLVTIYVISTAVLLILDLPNPSRLRANKYLRLSVFICTALLCLASMRTAMSISARTIDKRAFVNVTAKEGAPLTEVVCYWNGALGREAGNLETFAPSSENVHIVIPIQGNVLTVVASDARGVRMSCDFWYPWWLYRS